MSLPTYGKVIYTATLVKGHIAKFHLPYLKWFKEQGWETWVAANNDYQEDNCSIPSCDHFINIDFARSPFSKQTIVAYHQLKDLFNREKFSLVHTHTPVGSVLTRLAAKESRKSGTKIVYTAHGFHFYKGAPLFNWILWYPVEKLMTRYTDALITINREDYESAKRFSHCPVFYVPGVGIDLEKFKVQCDVEAKRREFNLTPSSKILLSVGDLTKNKNHAVAIRSLTCLPDEYVLLICGEGTERESLEELAKSLKVDKRVIFAGIRNDIPEILAMSDCFVFPSKREGLPVAVIEAMASGLPVVAARIRGIYPDLIVDHETGILLQEVTEESIANAVREFTEDVELRESIVQAARDRVQDFEISKTLEEVIKIYNSLLD